MKKLFLILSILAVSCQKEYNCRCFTDTPSKRIPLKDSTIKAGNYEQAHYECQAKNKQVNDSTDVNCSIF